MRRFLTDSFLNLALSALLISACSGSPAAVNYPVSDGHSSLPVIDSPMSDQGPFQPNAYLQVCNRIRISNQPDTDSQGRILNYRALIDVNGIVMAAAPANNVCLTSGFGPRSGRLHKGLDLQARPAGPVYSAAPGTVLEVSVQSGFGNQVVIGHGNGVFTRYAHLASFQPDLRVGQKIGFGQPLGQMGRTGNATAIHLHFEVLTGNYNTPKKSFGLSANNPLDFPAWAGLGTLG